MEVSQIVANEIKQIGVAMTESRSEPVDFNITPQHQMWIDYEALGGIITDSTNPDKVIRKMTISEFANMAGVDRKTLQRWRTQIPNFWERVAQRRNELNGQSRLAALHEKWYIQAMSFKNWAVTEAFLINFDPNYKTPKVHVEHEIKDNWIELARQKMKVIEGEVVKSDDRPADV